MGCGDITVVESFNIFDLSIVFSYDGNKLLSLMCDIDRKNIKKCCVYINTHQQNNIHTLSFQIFYFKNWNTTSAKIIKRGESLVYSRQRLTQTSNAEHFYANFQNR